MELDSGQVVSDQYEIRDQLGRGGFGVVYRAFDKKLAREVALKLLIHDQDIDGMFGQRFRREIKLVRQLEHPNVVRLYDFGEMAGSPYMVMEFVRGEEVADHLTRNGPMSLRLAQSLMLQVLDGLVAAHQINIIHRDLKPNNIMLTKVGMRSDFVKILDFGIAKAIHEAERDSKTTFETQNQLVGTPAYMAPEQLRQEQIGPYTDVYAAGLIFIELLTGRALLEGTMVEVVAKHIDSRPHELPARAKGGPFADLIRRAVAKNKDERFADAREMYKALAAIPIEGGPVVSIDTGPLPKVGSSGSGPATPRPSDALLATTGPVAGQPMVAEPAGPVLATTPTGEELKRAEASVRGTPTLQTKGSLPWLAIILAVLALAVAVGGGILIALAMGSGEANEATAAATDEGAESASATESPSAADATAPDVPATVAAVPVPAVEAPPTETPPSLTKADQATTPPTSGEAPESPEPTPPAVGSQAAVEAAATVEEPANTVAVDEPSSTSERRARRRRRSVEMVKIEFVTKPRGATVRVGKERCTSPCSLKVEKGKRITVHATKGHDSVKETITATRSSTVELRLFRGL